jgi:NAD(P)-dependent dehydrogenase (short-subunit alcohol dehydrogenase family)
MKNLQPSDVETYVVTGPTSGIGLCAAMELSAHGTVVLVGRDRGKLEGVQKRIEDAGRRALTVVCDLADLESIQRATAEIVALDLPITGLINNAGIMLTQASKNALGWDMTFATNHLGPFAFTDALVPYVRDGAHVVFVVSAIEDPERRPAKVMGMRGGRYISIEASARGEWKPGGARIPGVDAYATSKQCSLAAALAREQPRMCVNAVEPGINPTTGLGGANAFLRFLFSQVITRLPPFSRYRSTPERAAHVITKIVTDKSGSTAVYYDEKGQPMTGSALVHDSAYQARVVAETRAFLASATSKGASRHEKGKFV